MAGNIRLTQILLKRGPTANVAAYTGPIGEVVIDTGLNTLRLQDGLTPGGFPLATTAQVAQLSTIAANVAALTATVANIHQTDVTGINANISSLQSLVYTNANVAAYLPSDPTITGIESSIVTANTAVVSYVNNKIALLANAPAILDTLGQIATAIQNDENSIGTILGGQTAANLQISNLWSNAVTQNDSLVSVASNVSAQQTQINSLVASTYANVNVATYLGNYDGTINFVGSPAVITGLGSLTTMGINYSDNSSQYTAYLGAGSGINQTLGTSDTVTFATVNANQFVGDGGLLTNIQIPNNGVITTTGNIGSGNIIVINNISASSFTYANGQPYAGTYSNSNVASYLPTSSVIAGLQSNAALQESEITGLRANITAINAAIITANAAVVSYVNAQDVLLQSGITSANTSIVTANTAMKSYVDSGNTVMTNYVNNQVTTANTALKGYTDYQISTAINNLINSAPGTLDTLSEIAANLAAEAGAIGSITNSITSINANVTAANASIQTLNANVGAYENTINANLGSVFNHVNTLDANIGAYETWANAHFSNSTYSNTNVAAYLTGNITTGNVSATGYFWANGTPFASSNYGNTQVAAYLPTSSIITGINANVTAANAAIISANTAMKSYVDSQIIVAGNTGNITFSGDTISSLDSGVGINLNSGGAGKIHIQSYTGINNTNPSTWLEIGNWSDGVNTGNLAVSFGNPASGFKNTVLWDWDWWDAAGVGHTNNSSTVHNTFGLYRYNGAPGSGVTRALITFDANAAAATAPIAVQANGSVIMGNIYSGNVFASGYFYANGTALSGSTGNYNDSNVASYLPTSSIITGINSNVTAANTSIQTLNANVGSFYTWANTNFATGSTYSNTNVNALLSGNVSTGNLTIGHMQFHSLDNTITTDNGSGISFNNRINVNGSAVNLGLTVSSNAQFNSNISVGQNSNAQSFYGSGYYWAANGVSILSGIGGTYGNANVASYLPTYSGNVSAGNILASGYFWANGTPFASSNYGNTQVAAYLVANPQTGTYSNTNVAAYLSGNISVGNISATNLGNISAINLTGSATNVLYANGTFGPLNTGNIQVPMNYSIQTNSISGSITATGQTIATATFTTYGFPVYISLNGDANPGGSSQYGKIQFYRDGTAIGNQFWLESGVSGMNVSYNISTIDTPAAGSHTYTVRSVGAWSGSFTFGEAGGPQWEFIELAAPQTIYGNANVTALLSGFGSNTVSTTGNITAGNVLASGFFYANGTPFTSISYGNTQVAAYLLGNITAGNISGTQYGNSIGTTSTYSGNVTAANFVGSGQYLTNLNYNSTGNITGSSSNVTLVAGSYAFTFDNTGNLTMPTNSDLVFGGNTTLTSTSGTNGNITVNPDGIGQFVVTSITPAWFGNTVSVAGNLTVGNNNLVQQHSILSGVQVAPTASAIQTGAGIVLGGAGGNYLTFGQYPSGATLNGTSVSYAQWIQSGYGGNATPYAIVLNPVGGDVVVPGGGRIAKASAANLALNTTLSLDNLAIQIKTSGSGVWIYAGTVSGTTTYAYAITYQLGSGTVANAQGTNSTMSATTTPALLGVAGWWFSAAGSSATTVLTDTTANKMYRITWMTTSASSPYGNFVTIERL